MLTTTNRSSSNTGAEYAIVATLMIILSAISVCGAPPRHNASAITEGTFNSGNYTFPDSINITNTFQAAATLFVNPITERVGIRTNYPTQTLNVNGDANFTGDIYLPVQSLASCSGKLITDATGNVTCGADATGGGGMDYTNVAMTNQTNTFTAGQLIENTSAVDAYLNITDAGSSKLVVDSAGNVGIGTATPSSRLHAYETSVDDSVDKWVDRVYLNFTPSNDTGGWTYQNTIWTTLRVAPPSGISTQGLFTPILSEVFYEGDQVLNNTDGGYSNYFLAGYFNAAINNIQGSIIGNSSYVAGILAEGVQSSPASTVENLIGVWASAQAHQGNVTNAYGLKAEAFGNPIQGDSVTISKAYAVYAGGGTNLGEEFGNVSLTDFYGLYSERPLPTASTYEIQNAYGLYIENFSARGNTSDFNLYSDGDNSKNYFAGSIGINTTTPVQLLDVDGVMRLAPTDGPGVCNSTLKGSMYFDESMSEPCFCNSTDWSQFDGGGVCT